jgi:hypothetical protein
MNEHGNNNATYAPYTIMVTFVLQLQSEEKLTIYNTGHFGFTGKTSNLAT